MRYRVLIVDDSFYMRTMLKNMLTDAGYEIVGEASSGATVLDEIRATQPDLVTLDMILPDNTGLEVLKSIKKEFPSQKAVMVSAVGQESIVKEAMNEGALAYIVKPFSEDKVLEIISSVLQG